MGRRSDIKPLPSLERLRELFDYDPETGELRWRVQSGEGRSVFGFNNKCGGKIAGTVGVKGYLIIGIRYSGASAATYYLAHRIIWKLMTGDDPADQVDHEDTNKLNNRWRNLRPAENGPNIQNSRLRKDNTSGAKGVQLRVRGNYRRWRAIITANKKSTILGDFKTFEEAVAARAQAAERLHGQFARAC